MHYPRIILELAGIGLFMLSPSIVLSQSERTFSERAPKAAPYQIHCAGCHGRNLEGGAFGPPLKGAAFVEKWRGQPPETLQAFIIQRMPPAAPGGLSAEIYQAAGEMVYEVNGFQRPAKGIVASGLPAAAVQARQQISEYQDAYYRNVKSVRQSLLDKLSPVTERMLRNPSGADWLQWRRTDDAFGHSPLTAINPDTVGRLAHAWSISLPSGTNGITPLVHDGVIFVNSNGTVLAIDARNGDTLWKFERSVTKDAFAAAGQPRSMAIYGNRLYVPTFDLHMIALDIRTGKVLWDHAIDPKRVTHRISAGPMIVKGKVIQGVSGCDGAFEPGGCYIVALDAETGREQWRFNTIPKPEEAGGNSWNGAPWEKRFGASVWATGSYDPELDLVFVGTGQTYNYSPLMEKPAAGQARDALYTNTTLALDPDTGRLVWHYQHMPREMWDLDWAFERQIITVPMPHGPVKAVATIGKVGILDVLEARTGRYLFSQDMGMQTLVTGIDPRTGAKRIDPTLEPDETARKSLCPHASGLRNWPATSFDPERKLILVPFSDSCMKNYYWAKGQDWETRFEPDLPKLRDGNFGGIMAIDVDRRSIAWTRRQRAPSASAALATAGGIVFAGDTDRYFRAFDSSTGELLWQTRLDRAVGSSPISFAVDGRQYVAVLSGGGHISPFTPEVDGAASGITLWVFKL